MTIANLSSFSSLGPYQASYNQPFQTMASKLQANFEDAFVDITTSEGDTISLQQNTSHTERTQSAQWQNSSSQGVSFNAQTMDSHSFSYSVQGDLSAEELADLSNLFDSLSLIADDFYQGNIDEAVAGALNIGDMGSLSSLSASFSKTTISATEITSQHPYAMADLAKAESEEKALAQHRQAQWKQILAYLEKRDQQLENIEQKDGSKLKDHAQEIIARTKSALKNHKRLTHLINKLVEKALTDQRPGHQEVPPSESASSISV